MAERRNVIRDLAVRLGVVKDGNADRALDNFGRAISKVGRFAAIVAIDLAAYNAALSVANAKLGDRTWQRNIQRTENLIRTLATGVQVATGWYDQFAAGIGIVNAALVENARQTVRNAELLQMSTRDYQSMAYAFEEFGLTEEDVNSTLMRFGSQAGEALHKVRGPVSQAREEFAKLGITVQELTGRNPLGVMELIAEKLKGSANQQKAIEGVYRLLGEEAAGGFSDGLAKRLLPALQGGAGAITNLRRQALNNGLIIDDGLLRQGAELAEQFHVLQRQITAFWTSLGLRLVPAVRILVQAWQDLILANRGWIEMRLEQAISVLTAGLEALDRAMRSVDWELMFSIWAGWGLFHQAVATMLSLTANLFLLISAFQILRNLLPLLANGVRFLWVQFGLLFPATQLAMIATWEWVASMVAAIAAALGVATATGAILVVLAALLALLGLVALAVPFFLALWLIIEDITTWAKGGASVFGEVLAVLKDAFGYMAELGPLLKSVGRLGISIFRLFLTVVYEVAEAFAKVLGPTMLFLLEKIADFLGYDDIVQWWRAWTHGINDVSDAIDALTDSLSNLDQKIIQTLGGVASLFASGSQFAVDLSTGGITGAAGGLLTRGATSMVSNVINQNITVNGSDKLARAAGDESYRAAREALEGSTR